MARARGLARATSTSRHPARLPEGRRGREFSDSEVYKYLEAMAWEIGRRGGAGEPTDELEARFRAVVARVAAAQEPDGYLNTQFGRPGQRPRWSDLEWGHELYCLGHLFQAAVARVRTRPDADDGLVEVARRAADLVCDVFGEGGIERICGHAEVEVGLAELGRALGEPRYLRAGATLHRAARPRHAARHRVGSLVLPGRRRRARRRRAARPRRARELPLGRRGRRRRRDGRRRRCCGALDRQWDATVERRTYVTGGQGSHHQDEAFGEDWELPSDRAYSETCAGVASVMFSWRLLLAQGDPRYADQIERTLFNVDRDVAERRRHRVLLREHAAPARARAPRPTPTRCRRARSRRCARPGSTCRAARRTRPARSRASRGTSRRRMPRASSCTSTRQRRSAPRSPTGRTSRSTSRRTTRGRVRCGFACSRMPRSRGPSRCASRRGRQARGSSCGPRGPTAPPCRPPQRSRA